MDVQRGAQERYWKRTQVMSGVIFEKMDWRVGEATNGLIILEKTGKVRTCCMTGARIGQKEMDRRRQQSRAELIPLDKSVRMYYLAQELLGDTWTAIQRHMCRWSSSDTIKNVQYIVPCLGLLVS